MIPPRPHDLPEPQLKPNTEVVLQKRYLHKKADGSTETPRDLFWRVASAIAAEEAKYERSPFTADDLARQFYDLMTSWRFLPNSPTLRTPPASWASSPPASSCRWATPSKRSSMPSSSPP